MSIYTKKGDKGKTSLLDGVRVAKTELVFEVLGSFDQANAGVGLIRSFLDPKEPKLAEELEEIQKTFFGLGARLAADQQSPADADQYLEKRAGEFEGLIDDWEQQLPPLRNFILPGGPPAASAMHLTRTFVRAAERQYHRLPAETKIEAVSRYLNRLSDLFFQMARFYNHQHQQKETIWKER